MTRPNYAPAMAAILVGLLTPEQLRDLVRRALRAGRRRR